MALGAAALFGASFPCSKLLLGELGPVALAGILYLSSGLGLGALRVIQGSRSEAALRRSDLGWLLGSVISGGIVGPVLLLLGLSRTTAQVSALLANTETVFTVLLAISFFGDFLLRREIVASVLILGGATLVAWAGARREGHTSWGGPVLLLAAGLSWGLDNNFSQRISAKDPLQIAAIKGLVAGLANLALAVVFEGIPRLSPGVLSSAFGLGLVSYGLSIVCFLTALRHLGTARTSALFATAPLFAMALSWALLKEVPGPWTGLGALLMIPGAWFLIRADHSHTHVHDSFEHDHRHVHDEHHHHDHVGDEGPEPHAHPHRHSHLEHAHPHSADLHHRHPH
jgi:drug/metabolite transporter (DMT)-like permease